MSLKTAKFNVIDAHLVAQALEISHTQVANALRIVGKEGLVGRREGESAEN